MSFGGKAGGPRPTGRYIHLQYRILYYATLVSPGTFMLCVMYNARSKRVAAFLHVLTNFDFPQTGVCHYPVFC